MLTFARHVATSVRNINTNIVSSVQKHVIDALKSAEAWLELVFNLKAAIAAFFNKSSKMKKASFDYPYNGTLSAKVLSIVRLLKEPTIDEISAEIIELQGVASEEGVAECTVSIVEVLKQLARAGEVKAVEAKDDQLRYAINE